jgi:hypothetical protein
MTAGHGVTQSRRWAKYYFEKAGKKGYRKALMQLEEYTNNTMAG